MALGLLVAGVLALARTSDGAPNDVPATLASPLAGDAVAGKETFTQYCSICHGVRATGFIGPYIAGINWTAPGLIAIVRQGVGGYGGMPAFNADVVTDENLANVAAYLASLPPAAAPKSATPSQTVAVVASPVPVATPASAVTATATASAPTPASATVGNSLHGRQVYAANCAACHGASAQGGVGPALRGEKNRKDTAAAIAWIKNPKLPMPKLYPTVLSEKDVEDVAAYVESL
jgi:mono/diheme cytochrome c family protein